MKYWFKFLFSLLLIALISGCGVDKLKPAIKSTQSSLRAPNKECSCLSSYSPVCGIDGKDYDNICWAQCQTDVAKPGHCQCSDTLIVCGSDDQDYSECEAVANPKLQIKKFSPCNSVGH